MRVKRERQWAAATEDHGHQYMSSSSSKEEGDKIACAQISLLGFPAVNPTSATVTSLLTSLSPQRTLTLEPTLREDFPEWSETYLCIYVFYRIYINTCVNVTAAGTALPLLCSSSFGRLHGLSHGWDFTIHPWLRSPCSHTLFPSYCSHIVTTSAANQRRWRFVLFCAIGIGIIYGSQSDVI